MAPSTGEGAQRGTAACGIRAQQPCGYRRLELNLRCPKYTEQRGQLFCSDIQEAEMVLKRLVPVLACAGSLALASAALADEYRADEYLSLDLSKAVMSPKPLGPAQKFAPVAVEAKSDKNDRSEAGWARNELKTEPRKVAVQDVKDTHPYRVTRPHRATHTATENRASESRPSAKPKGSARIKLAHRHRNPLDAEAMDTRIQKWPCRSGEGGICEWK
jgi:hypothetical protein